ncbi:MAG TPA: sucrase ferredoxin [Chloroflexia bacterium]
MLASENIEIQPQDTREMCSQYSLSHGEDPIGSAVVNEHYVVMELPMPWPADAWHTPQLPAGVREVARLAQENGLDVRSLAIVPDAEYSLEGHTRLFHFHRPEGYFSCFDKQEFLVPTGLVAELLAALYAGPEALAPFETYRQDSGHIREMLVCTHGTRDACCGKFGYPLYDALRNHYAPASEGRLRVWRVSHLGGHRFSPTLLDFPGGHYWGRLNAQSVATLMTQDRPPESLRMNYRGWAGLDALSQVVEREILGLEGWRWLDYLKSSRVLDMGEHKAWARVRIDYTSPDGTDIGAYDALVEQNGTVLSIGSCRGNEPPKEREQYGVIELVKLDNVGKETETPRRQDAKDAPS